MQCIDDLGLPYKQVAKETGLDIRRIRRIRQATPQLHFLHALAVYIQDQARVRAVTSCSSAK
jgi:hypothetical protein